MSINPVKPVPTVVYCKCAEDIPKVRHWAIINTRTGIEAGYDKGDPDTRFTFVEYAAYLVEDEWKKEITSRALKTQNSSERIDFVAIEVKPAVITTSVAVNIAS